VTGERAKYALIDTGFWFALLSADDGRHTAAKRIYGDIERFHGLMPWPVLYEVMNTKLVRRPRRLEGLEKLLRSPGIHRIDDRPYREAALTGVFPSNGQGSGLSLVDRVLVGVLSDRNVRVDALVTFNPRDFVGPARQRGVELICE